MKELENIVLSQEAEEALEKLKDCIHNMLRQAPSDLDVYKNIETVTDLADGRVDSENQENVDLIKAFIQKGREHILNTGKIPAYGTEHQATYAKAHPESYDYIGE